MVNLASFWKMRQFRWFSNTVEKLLTWRCCPGGFSFLDFLSRSISHFHSTAAFSGRPTWSSEKLRILLQALKSEQNYRCCFYRFTLRIYRVSQQVWNGLKTMFWYSEVCERSELRFGKNVFCSKKLLFKPCLWTAKLKMEFLGNFSPIVLYSKLFSKLLEIGEKLLKNPFSFLAVFKKGWKSNFLERNTIFL